MKKFKHWNGGKTPFLKNTFVEVEFNDHSFLIAESDDLFWENRNNVKFNIIKYREI